MLTPKAGAAQGVIQMGSVSNMNKVAWTLLEASAAIGISEGTLRRHEKAGRLKFTKIGGRTLILDNDFQRFVHSGGEPPAGDPGKREPMVEGVPSVSSI
jgi:hypothetical protein